MRVPALVLAVVAGSSVALLSGCGSSSSGASSPAAATTLPGVAVCTQISGTLGNGPDPDADPVGYAEAQIKPLAAIHPSNPKLATAVTALDHAYQGVFTTGNSPASKTAVRAAQRQVNAICPGAAS
jgi:hypothetical protein